MCYAIPGEIKHIEGKVITLDYFGDERKARNDFYSLSLGDFVYAQGGFVVQKVGPNEAKEILDTWKEFFFDLKETDARLAQIYNNEENLDKKFLSIMDKATYGKSISRDEALKLLYSDNPDEFNVLTKTANFIRQKFQGNACCVHGIVEFSNNCNCLCSYCGINVANKELKRYRFSTKEIFDIVEDASIRLGFKAIVLQSGEDSYYTSKELLTLIERLREKLPVLIFLSIGEREESFYKEAFDVGARAVLFRFETSDSELYSKIHPQSSLKERIRYIELFKEIGYLVATGGLIGIPGQKPESIIDDLLLAKELGSEMYSFGPFISHPGTTLSGFKSPEPDYILKVLSILRLLDPYGNIVVTTALETINSEARRQALMSGANSVMLNLTPEVYRQLYDIYPDRVNLHTSIEEQITNTLRLLQDIGRAPTDLGL